MEIISLERITKTVTFSDTTIDLIRGIQKLKEEIKGYVEGKEIIDLGCGDIGSSSKYANFLIKELGAKGYTGIDDNISKEYLKKGTDAVKRIIYIKTDALDYLKNQIAESAIITANGFVTSDILNDKDTEKLQKEIYRVVPKNGIFFGTYIENPGSFEKCGFKRIGGENELSLNIFKK